MKVTKDTLYNEKYAGRDPRYKLEEGRVECYFTRQQLVERIERQELDLAKWKEVLVLLDALDGEQ